MMAVLKIVALFSCTLLGISNSRFVDTMSKCSIYDNACQGALVQKSLKAIHKTGIPELGIPPIDPLEFKDITISELNLFNLTATEGKIKGVKDCVVLSLETDIKRGHSELKINCPYLIIKTKYRVTGTSPLLKNLLGGDSIHGEGNGKVKIENINLKLTYLYDIEKKSDGDLYFTWKFDKTIYDYEVKGKVSFAADSIYLGDTDATQLILGTINENSKFVVATFGKPFMDKAMEIVYTYTHEFFNNSPAKYYITEDLSPFIKKN